MEPPPLLLFAEPPFPRDAGCWERVTPHAVPLRPLLSSAGLSKKLVEIFQQIPLGRFLAQLSVKQQQELFVSYMKDFLLLTMRPSTWDQLNVSVGSGAG